MNFMNIEEILKKLKSPFPYEDIDWKVQVTNKDKTRGMAVPYLDSRAIQKRLDDAVGAMNWTNEFMLWQDKSQICGIGLYDAERGAWVMKYDGAENTDIEPVKGGLSDSFKRAAVLWGIGRYLYDMESIWVEIEPSGKSYRIKKSEYDKLRRHYDKSVAALADGAPAPKAQRQDEAGQEPPETEDYNYIIKSVSDSGKSVCLKLEDKTGKAVSVYAKKGDTGLISGAKLRTAKFEKKKADFGAYYTMSEYEVAA